MVKKIRATGTLILVILWGGLAAFNLLLPAKEASLAERRPLNQFPKITADSIFSGRFMESFEKYTNDQFPARDTFRRIKTLTHLYLLGQQDVNDLYLTEGYLVEENHPLVPDYPTNATTAFQAVYDQYLNKSGSKVFCAVIPDKGYYLAQSSGHLTPDYDALFALVEEKMPYATHIPLTDVLSKESYYYTDTHWRQETLLPVVQRLCGEMGVPAPESEDFNVVDSGIPFYGVYHGQAALPLPAEPLYLMESPILDGCTVSIHNGKKFVPVSYQGVYDREKLSSKEPYDVFLSGPQSVIQIENPNAATDRELIIFRDSFGSSVTPLLAGQYKTVTLVDIRYVDRRMLTRYVDFHGQDVLFLYSSLVLNKDIIR